MSEFEFFFSLFGLLLGLSLVEVVSGLVRTVKVRKTTRLGWLTPLLGLFVMLDLTSFWANAWDMRTQIPVHFAALYVGMFFSAAYYFAASLVFPERPESCKDLDTWYFQHRREVLGIVMVLELILTAYVFASNWLFLHWINIAVQVLYFTLLITAFSARGKRVNAAALAGLSFLYIFVGLLPFLMPALVSFMS
jgi:hypothetical protein